MMIDNKKHTLPFVQLDFRRFVFIVCLILLFLLPRISSAALVNLGDEYSESDYKEYCNVVKFNEKYSPENSCWPCSVINSLTDTLFETVNDMINTVNNLAKLILLLGAAIWLAIYFLKSVSSLATQDSAKILDGALSFMFKVAFMYVLVNGGIANIISWIITPLLSIGMDVSSALKLMTAS